MRWSIRYQLLVPLVLLLLGVLGISTWTALAAAARARQQIETRLAGVVRTLGGSRFPLTRNVLEQMKGFAGAEFLLVAEDGRRTTTLPQDNLPLPADAVADDVYTLRLGSRLEVGGEVYLCSGVRLGPLRADTGGVLLILYPEALWRDARWEAVRPSLVLGGFVGLASVAVALGVGRRLGRRIRELERRTRLIADGDFSPMPLTGGQDELRALGESINEMARRLAQLQETVRKTERLRLLGQVSGGLAHQLRNSVTGAMLAVQLHARACASGADPEALDVALRQLALLESNLKRFLDLGRTKEMRRERCALSALVDQAVALLRPQCRHARIDLRWQRPDAALTLQGDAAQLGHLILNLLGNAVEAAGPGGWVHVGLLIASEKSAILEVSDSGPGPPADIAAQLFEPFVTGKPDGVGLGLAVARQVAEAHGGRVTWRCERDRTCFRVELPLEQQA